MVAVIGDGAMTAGQAYEAMNNSQVSLPTATLDGAAPPVGALTRALTKLQSSKKLRKLREVAKVTFYIYLS